MSVKPPGTRWYNAVWRWHFYAALLCVPFVIWLALTGTIYTWKPQIEGWIDRPYDTLAVAPAASVEAQVAAALAAVPRARLHKYELPEGPGHAARVIVGTGKMQTRVYVDPATLRVLKQVGEEERFMRYIFRLHGELMAGNPGSYLVELAACWAIVMILTGLYLWWPRGATGLGGLLYPRLRQGRRLFWRDIHAVSGIWVSLLALGLITTGLPWAKAWGGYFKEVRAITGTADGPVDWPTGVTSVAAPPAVTTPGERAMLDEHAEHMGMSMAHLAPRAGDLDRVVRTIMPLRIAPPVLVAPPADGALAWTVTSDADNRPLRTQLTIDGRSGEILSRRNFDQRHWIDRAVGYGIAAHEGALFGIANQLLGTLAALLLVTLAVSGTVLWWRRRPVGLIGAPIPLSRPRFGPVLIGVVVLLGVLLPLFGASLIAVLVIERLALRRIPPVRYWLGLRAA
ncbi:PepSY domain-containing protein [Sphingomonas sp. So64.6b]|uniref:PepSY-associated TM helix domain-containing protein n=1 Tax=Sphingomonas sp. So64.6b TaxID=2997354 RepID=UPI001602F088|nr:PepSY domain-containing protein [Sphingomonas sp. So64.6b]QNA82750.1 PepSY domain-containing protein [Sphingomonas sp. So64.6b]